MKKILEINAMKYGLIFSSFCLSFLTLTVLSESPKTEGKKKKKKAEFANRVAFVEADLVSCHIRIYRLSSSL